MADESSTKSIETKKAENSAPPVTERTVGKSTPQSEGTTDQEKKTNEESKEEKEFSITKLYFATGVPIKKRTKEWEQKKIEHEVDKEQKVEDVLRDHKNEDGISRAWALSLIKDNKITCSVQKQAGETNTNVKTDVIVSKGDKVIFEWLQEKEPDYIFYPVKKLEFNTPIFVVAEYTAEKDADKGKITIQILEKIPGKEVTKFDDIEVKFLNDEVKVFDGKPVTVSVFEDGKDHDKITLDLKKGKGTAFKEINIRPTDPKDFCKVVKKITERFDKQFKDKNYKEKKKNTSRHSTFLYINLTDDKENVKEEAFNKIKDKIKDFEDAGFKDEEKLKAIKKDKILYECSLKTEDKYRTHFVVHCVAIEMSREKCVGYKKNIVNAFVMKNGDKIFSESFRKHRIGATKLESFSSAMNKVAKKSKKYNITEDIPGKVNFIRYIKKGSEKDETNYNSNGLPDEFKGRSFHIELNYSETPIDYPNRIRVPPIIYEDIKDLEPIKYKDIIKQYQKNHNLSDEQINNLDPELLDKEVKLMLDSIPESEIEKRTDYVKLRLIDRYNNLPNNSNYNQIFAGLKNIDHYLPTQEQYEGLAQLYIQAHKTLEKEGYTGDDTWPIIVPHIEVDRGFFNGHKDPTDFDFNRFYRLLENGVEVDGNTEKVPKNRISCFFNNDRFWGGKIYEAGKIYGGINAGFKEPGWDNGLFSWPPVLSGNPFAETVESNDPAKCMVFFRPNKDYLGEYGFDWIRYANEDIITQRTRHNNTYNTKDLLGKYVIPCTRADCDYKTICSDPAENRERVCVDQNLWSTNFQPDINSDGSDGNQFTELKRDYFPDKLIITGFDSSTDNEYRVPVISVIEGKEAKLRVFIHVKIDGTKEVFDKESLTWSYDKNLFDIDPPKLADKVNPSAQTSLQEIEITLTCKKSFADIDKKIEVKYNGTLCGQLNISPNSKNENGNNQWSLNVVLVQAVVDIKKTVLPNTEKSVGDFNENDIKSFFNILNQSCIQCKVKVRSLDLSKTDEFKNIYTTADGKKIIDEDEDRFFDRTDKKIFRLWYHNKEELIPFLNRQLKESYKDENFDNYYKIYAFDEKYKSGGHGYSPNDLNVKGVVVFKDHNRITIVHELLHQLGLDHTFSYKDMVFKRKKITKNALFTYRATETENIMDYGHAANFFRNVVNIEAISTFSWQWELLRQNVEKINKGERLE